jgi:hypothetical protein
LQHQFTHARRKKKSAFVSARSNNQRMTSHTRQTGRNRQTFTNKFRVNEPKPQTKAKAARRVPEPDQKSRTQVGAFFASAPQLLQHRIVTVIAQNTCLRTSVTKRQRKLFRQVSQPLVNDQLEQKISENFLDATFIVAH